jgi:L-malate glycosyltransferase
MKKIICVHLFNDFSGSPLVLSTVVKNLVAAGQSVEVITSRNTQGFLSGLEGVKYRFFTYRFFENKALRLLMLLWGQAAIFFKILKYFRQDVVIYVNTLLPFGAAMAGKLLGKKVVYHLHETTVNPPVLKNFLKQKAAGCASEAIYVSKFLKEQEPLASVPSRVIYNCMSKDFTEKAAQNRLAPLPQAGRFTVLMLCSLKEYKGVNEFVKLSEMLPDYAFVLVLNSSQEAIREFFTEHSMPENLVIFPAQTDVHSFYREANLVLNLSHPERWVETFGMTLLEAMTYGLPVISPAVGGPAELVEDGYNGFKIDQRNLDLIAEKIRDMAENKNTYDRLSANALRYAARFEERQFASQILKVVTDEVSTQRKEELFARPTLAHSPATPNTTH